MSDKSQIVTRLKMLRDVLNDFSSLVENLNATTEKHGLPLNEIKNFELSKTDSIKILATLPPEKLALLMGVAIDIASMKEGLSQFMNYNADQLADFNKHLKTAIEKFDSMLEGI